MDILYVLLYIIGTALVVLILLWIIGLVVSSFGIVIPNNIRLLIGLFLLVVFLIIIFNMYPIGGLSVHHRHI